jgi:cell division inhibitor SepF
MASMWRRAMHYLGLGPDDEYDDDLGYGYDESAPERPEQRAVPTRAVPPRPVVGGEPARPVGSVTGIPETAAVRPLPVTPAGREPVARTSGSVRAVAVSPKVHPVAPAGFNDAQEVGDRFKAGQPVLMDLAGVDRDLARRLIDFCSGLCYGLGGQMERLAGQSYLITPAGAEVPADERRRLAADAGA